MLLRDALLENLHRANLNALEEAAAYQQLLDDFGCTQEELATRIGRSRPQVSNTLRLLRLPAPVQRRVAAGVLSAGHARALLSLDDTDAMDSLATRIVAEGLSVRAVEEIVAVGEADGRERVRVARPRTTVAPGLTEIADRLSDRLETRVRVEAGKSKGKVTDRVRDHGRPSPHRRHHRRRLRLTSPNRPCGASRELSLRTSDRAMAICTRAGHERAELEPAGRDGLGVRRGLGHAGRDVHLEEPRRRRRRRR